MSTASLSYARKFTSIIISTYNSISYLQQCVASVCEHTFTPYEIIIIVNGSQDGTIDYCIREKLFFISFLENKVFSAACNSGMLLATGEQLLLLNDDVMVSYRWMDNMLAALYESSMIGLVGTVTNYASGIQQVNMSYKSIEQY